MEGEQETFDDFDKARFMAEAEEEYLNENTARLREELQQPWAESIKHTMRTQLERWKAKADDHAELMGIYYDVNKAAENMSDPEVQEKANQMFQEKKKAYQSLLSARDAYNQNPSETMRELTEEAAEQDVETKRESFAWDKINKERKSKE